MPKASLSAPLPMGFSALALGIAGCATSDGDPGPTALRAGSSCQSVRSELKTLDKKGVPSLIQAQSAGKKLTAPQKAQAERYHDLLNQYLGARCHV